MDKQTWAKESPKTNPSKQHLIALWLIMAMAAILSCRFGAWTASPTPEAPGQVLDSSEQDVKYALQFTGNTFKTDDWQRSYQGDAQRVSVTWLNNDQMAVAYLEYLFFSNGYTQADVADYFSERSFKEVIFGDYQHVQQMAKCTDDKENLTLYEFSVQWQEQDYLIRYWIKLDSKTRILTLLLAFPETSETLMDRYAKDIFLTLSSCQE